MPCANSRILAAFAAVASTAVAVEPAYGKTIIYDATGGTENGGDGFKAAGNLLLDCILTGPLGEKLTSVVLNLSASKPQDGGEFRIVLTPFNSNGFPGPGWPHVVIGVVTDAKLTHRFALTTVTPNRAIKLKANTRYFIGVARHPFTHSSVTFGNTVDPTVLARPSVMAGQFFYNNRGLQGNSGGSYEIQVNVTP